MRKAILVFLCVFAMFVMSGAGVAQVADFNDVLSQISTPLMNNLEGRTNNIVIACKKINGTILKPGEQFSFNKAVGNRTAKRGYKKAPAFMNGQIIQSIGGGVCQPSSTLYHACLLANLEIVSRTNHSMSPDYLEQLGCDATVDWGVGIDYKFKNNTKHPIKILTWLENKRVHVKIMGTKTNSNTTEIESKVLYTNPAKIIYKDNPKLKPGKTNVIRPAFNGYVIQTYRVIKDENGKVISRKSEEKSEYKRLDGITERNKQE